MSNKYNIKSKSAFTLIELLVSVAIFGILSLLIVQFLVNFMNMKFNTETRQRIRQEGNYALDRIEFLVRNSITLPDICCVNRVVPCVPLSASSINYDEAKLNTKGTTTNVFFQRHRVKLMNEELVLFSSNDSPKHNENNAWWNTVSNSINLTARSIGSSGTVPFTVSGLTFSCRKDTFTKGYIVKINFTITYDRKTFGSNSPSIVEKFERETAVVNTNPFEN